MQIRGTTRLIGLLGDPVGHSLSPAMHNAALAATDIDAVYVALPVQAQDLGVAVAGLRAFQFLGANVTLPHKTAVIPFLDSISDLSKTLGAVNTIVNRDGRLHGDTTDAAGFIAAFENEGHSFEGKSVAILGNGGSARTIAFALALKTKARRTALVARAPEKSRVLIDEIRSVAPHAAIDSISLTDFADASRAFDIVVNTTPVGMFPHVDETPLPAESLEAGQIVYDIVYNPRETRLLRDAKQRGCVTIGGIGMLVHQGRLSFDMWTGRSVPADVFFEGIRQQQAPNDGAIA